MVSIFCSSLPFSRAVLSSFCEGTSAALSWCTCSPRQRAGARAVRGQVFASHQTVGILEKRRHGGGWAAAGV
jgi:hypothetical protein